jgi:2-dehydro-3-deoxyphosphogluconate aldolase/(4S)-4-hydroxy-2-oxoglutarate aldolase
MSRTRREQTTADLRAAGVVAVVRTPTKEQAIEATRAISAGGVVAAEVTFTVPGAADAIAELKKLSDAGDFGQALLLGAGTVVTADQAKAAVDAGATYFVSPHLSEEVMAVADELDVAALPGAFTPGEVYAARQRGADIVKIFPAKRLGPAYLKDLGGPFPDIPLMPTGGVSAANAADWIAAGAVALGVGSELVDKAAVAAGDWATLTERAVELIQAVRQARGG